MRLNVDHKVQILVAIIGVVGIIVAATISNLDKIVAHTEHKNPDKKASTTMSAKLLGVSFYKGDKDGGGLNTCTQNQVLVREAYRLENTPSSSLLVNHTSKAGTRTQPVRQISAHGVTNYYFCASVDYLVDYEIKTIFEDGHGNGTEPILFAINIKGERIRAAEEWRKQIN